MMAQGVKEAEITEQDSLLLTRNLLRIAIFNISYIRGLFPEKYFNDKSVPALGMKIKKLIPVDAESRRMIDWMEKGVYDALQKKYLKTLLFCICETVEGPMIEEYSFSFSYSDNDSQEVSMDINRTGEKKAGKFKHSSATEVSPNQMRSSACKMIRTLVQLMRTLDKMPEERTILMKLIYYDDVTPVDYEPPFFRGCTDEESHNTWTKSPLKMEVGNVNSKHFVLALKVKSLLDPCEDENDDADGGVSLGDDSADGAEYTDTESEGIHSQENQYIVAPVAKQHVNQDAVMDAEDDTQHPTEGMEEFVVVKDWILSFQNDKVELTDVLSKFPDISVVLIEEIMERLVKGATLAKMGRDSYAINKPKASIYEFPAVKEENDGLLQLAFVKAPLDVGDDYLYMKALYYALPMNYITVGKLQNKLETNQGTVRKLIDRMTREGYLEATTTNKRLGRRVIKSALAEKKLTEIKKALNHQAMDIDIAEPIQTVIKHQKDMSTLGGVHSIGSDLTRTRSEQTVTKGHGNSPTSRAQPAASRESAVPGYENNIVATSTNHHEEVNKIACSGSTLDKRARKGSTVKEPIVQYVKRQKSAL